jgi:hypothetical protein
MQKVLSANNSALVSARVLAVRMTQNDTYGLNSGNSGNSCKYHRIGHF